MLTTRSINGKNAKLGQKGSGMCRVTYFCNFGSPAYLGNGWS